MQLILWNQSELIPSWLHGFSPQMTQKNDLWYKSSVQLGFLFMPGSVKLVSLFLIVIFQILSKLNGKQTETGRWDKQDPLNDTRSRKLLWRKEKDEKCSDINKMFYSYDYYSLKESSFLWNLLPEILLFINKRTCLL